jgi:hypothetical protein
LLRLRKRNFLFVEAIIMKGVNMLKLHLRKEVNVKEIFSMPLIRSTSNQKGEFHYNPSIYGETPFWFILKAKNIIKTTDENYQFYNRFRKYVSRDGTYFLQHNQGNYCFYSETWKHTENYYYTELRSIGGETITHVSTSTNRCHGELIQMLEITTEGITTELDYILICKNKILEMIKNHIAQKELATW